MRSKRRTKWPLCSPEARRRAIGSSGSTRSMCSSAFCLEVENRWILAGVRDLEDAVADHEGLVALAAEVARLAFEAEELGGDGGDLLRREARRGRLEDVQGRGCDHALILRGVRIGHLVALRLQEHDIGMLWRRNPPALPLTEQDVQTMFKSLFEIQAVVTDIWRVVGGDEDGEEEDEP